MANKPGWVPPVSPYGLIQEILFPDEWMILVSCMMLNCTSRKQVDRVLPEFMKRWPTPESFLQARAEEVADLCKPLGFANRRTKNLFAMTTAYVTEAWSHASELPGIGVYASRAWEIFCRGELGDEPPKDHALVRYWSWARSYER